jgi:hypothetical protein
VHTYTAVRVQCHPGPFGGLAVKVQVRCTIGEPVSSSGMKDLFIGIVVIVEGCWNWVEGVELMSTSCLPSQIRQDEMDKIMMVSQ